MNPFFISYILVYVILGIIFAIAFSIEDADYCNRKKIKGLNKFLVNTFFFVIVFILWPIFVGAAIGKRL